MALATQAAAGAAADGLPDGFVDAQAAVPGLRADLRYVGSDNFVGRPVEGYEGTRVILTEPAARALASAQARLAPFGLGLLVYDAYRPTRAVAHFVRWAEDPDDLATKERFYPDKDKPELFAEGYIAARSSHSRGSTVDLTIVDLATGEPLDMGTPFDLFSPRSWTESPDVPPQARANRLLLRDVMTAAGFERYDKEWWHFTLADEPHPEEAFDFPVR